MRSFRAIYLVIRILCAGVVATTFLAGCKKNATESANYPAPEVGIARVALAGEQGFPHTGKIDFLDNQINPETGTIRVRVVLRNADNVFTPGLYARVQFAGEGKTDALLIDEKAIQTDQGRKYVYVLGPENKALRKDVVAGRLIDGLRIVESGLAATDKVVVTGFQKIFFPGMPVTPVDAEASAPAGPLDTEVGMK